MCVLLSDCFETCTYYVNSKINKFSTLIQNHRKLVTGNVTRPREFTIVINKILLSYKSHSKK